MTFNPRDYHPDWKSISRQIRDQAYDKCEFCSVPNGAVIVRDRRRPERWRSIADTQIDAAIHDGDRVTWIVLTVAHLNHRKTDNDPANLRALCQRCHLLWDMDNHIRNAAQTRRRKRIESGQAVLL